MKAEDLNKYWTDIYFCLHYAHEDKITHQAIRILQLVEKKQRIGINDISTYLKVSHNTASEHVKRNIEKKYLIKERDPADERRVILKLTELGKEVLERNTSLDKDKLQTILNRMTSEEEAMVEAAFKLLKDRADHVHHR
ncbi:MarR family winged helix-turn-helix transcriptional regulator [Pseudalkalibacillus sp. SCS-8]|uniref:MarR family winged helix-turn-helix transcriptional regulator n=1 Tax=Pseudalkalibacillus nanhaiensis TaxID=3115291 RepID=UPI0032DACB22